MHFLFQKPVTSSSTNGKDKSTKSCLNVETIKAVVSASEDPPRASIELEERSPVTTIRPKKCDAAPQTASDPKKSEEPNEGKKDDANSQEETVPEVRIQPASLEVLASHRYRSCPTSQSVIKVMLRPKSQEAPSAGGCTPTSVENGFGSCPKWNGQVSPKHKSEELANGKMTNGYGSENGGSSCDEETPEVRIVHASSSNHYEKGAMPVASYRKSNSNKTPSFVVIRTPTPSPRLTRDKVATPNGTAATRLNGAWRPKIPAGSQAGKDKRPVSYAGGGPSDKKPQRAEKNSDVNSVDHGSYEKTKSLSCVHECEKKESFNHFMTESSV